MLTNRAIPLTHVFPLDDDAPVHAGDDTISRASKTSRASAKSSSTKGHATTSGVMVLPSTDATFKRDSVSRFSVEGADVGVLEELRIGYGFGPD